MSDALDNARAALRNPFDFSGKDRALRDLIAEHERLSHTVDEARKRVREGADADSVRRALEPIHERLTAPPTDDEREALSIHLAGWDSGEAFLTAEDAERDGQNMVWWRAVANSALVWFRRQGPVTEGWEYGWRDERPIAWTRESNMSSSNVATVYPYKVSESATRVRRRATKPGPWEPVVSTEKNE